jgi:hypothetical protein
MRAAPRIPRELPQPARKRSMRVRVKHREFVRSLPCVACGGWSNWPPGSLNSECAHVRMGTDGGTALKPSDRYTVPLCGGPEGCHARQHQIGEPRFWSALGVDPLDLALRLWTVSGDLDAGVRAVERARQSIALHRRAAAVPEAERAE